MFNLSDLSGFCATDPFNGHELRGEKCRTTDHRYGALLIDSVNGKQAQQVVYGTPKMHYPFDRNGDFRFPVVEKLVIYDKLDGTNILSYRYEYEGREYTTFKTRLVPALSDSKYGSFLELWRECLDSNPWIMDAIDMNPDFNLSFEMYGYRNPITVSYNVPLDVALLFGVGRTDAHILPPDGLNLPSTVKLPDRFEAGSDKDLIRIYGKMREQAEARNSESLLAEGTMFYILSTDGVWSQYKCKPETIEKIHWANGGIPWNALFTTAMNMFESEDEPSLDCLVSLLKEEYTDQQIGRVEARVKKAFGMACERVEFVKRVNDVWRIARNEGFDIVADKNATMRFLSNYFDKSDMRRVASVVLNKLCTK